MPDLRKGRRLSELPPSPRPSPARAGEGGPACTRQRPERRRSAVPSRLFLCLVIRLSTLGHLALWLDEVTTADVIAMDWPALVGNRLGQGHFPTYFALLKALGLAGGSEFALRLPSAIVDSLAGGLVVLLGRRLDGWPGAIAAMLLYALMPNLIQYGQEARPYALMLLFVIVAMTAQAKLLDDPALPGQQAAIATIGTLGAAFAIPAGIVAVATQHLALLAVPLRRMSQAVRRAWTVHIVVTWAAILLGVAVLIPAVREQAARPAGLMKWQSHFSFAQRASEAFGETFGFVIPHDANRFLSASGNGWLAAAFIALMVIGLAANRERPVHRALAVTVIGTPILYALIGIVSASAGRYMIGMMPAAILLAAAGVHALLAIPRMRLPAAILLAAFFASMSLQAADALVSERKYDWRPIAAFLHDNGIRNVEILSDAPQTEQDLGHYLPPADGIRFATIDPDHQSIDSLWSRASGRPITWSVITAWRDPPDDLTAGATVCTWPFGEMKAVVIAQPGSAVPSRLRDCGRG